MDSLLFIVDSVFATCSNLNSPGPSHEAAALAQNLQDMHPNIDIQTSFRIVLEERFHGQVCDDGFHDPHHLLLVEAALHHAHKPPPVSRPAEHALCELHVRINAVYNVHSQPDKHDSDEPGGQHI
jgi:hypothetical protein